MPRTATPEKARSKPAKKQAAKAPAKKPARAAAKRGGGRAADTPPKRTPAPRRLPKQSRGWRRVEKIMDAAAVKLIAGGPEAVTTTALAEEAGMAVGTFYQYFADRDAVLFALYDHVLARLAGEVAADIKALPQTAPWEKLVDQFLDQFLASAVEEPTYVPLVRFVAAYRHQEQDPAEAIGPLGEVMALVLLRIAPQLRDQELLIVHRVATTMLSSLVDLALCQYDLKTQGGILYELRFAMKGYLARFAAV